MIRLSPRSPRALAVCGLFVACLALLPAFNTSPRAAGTSCAELKRWALSYSDRSVTIAELANLNPAQQRAVFNAVSPIVRSQIVRDHLRQVARRSDLSSSQIALVNEGIDLATPAFYTRREPATMATFEQFWRRVETAFPANLRRVWFVLGQAPRAPQSAGSLLDRLSGVAKLHAQDVPPCECNFNYPQGDCGGGWCPTGGCWEYWGCGPNGWYTCTGTCAP
jgi:hypothetical protein